MISFIILLTSAWKACFSDFSLNSFIWATLKPSNLIASSSLSTASSSVFEPSLLFPISSSTFGASSAGACSACSSQETKAAWKKMKWLQKECWLQMGGFYSAYNVERISTSIAMQWKPECSKPFTSLLITVNFILGRHKHLLYKVGNLKRRSASFCSTFAHLSGSFTV